MTKLMDSMSGRRVVVTGGAGVIAGELLRQLSDLGATVLSVDRLPIDEPPPGVEHHQADLAFADLEPIVRFRPQHLLHLAATFERSVESPEFWEQSWSDNVIATHRLAELAPTIEGLESFVFASSYLIYDPRQYMTPGEPTAPVVLREDARQDTRNLCGAAKLYGEAELRFASEVRHAPFRTVNARIFRVYGRGSRDVVSRWVRSALAGEPVDVYHPENRFDYVFSGDVAEGLLRMAATPGVSGTFNLATGRSRPVADVIRAIERATGTTLDARQVAVDEPFEASCADLSALQAALDWAPDTTLEQGVERLVGFEQARARAASIG